MNSLRNLAYHQKMRKYLIIFGIFLIWRVLLFLPLLYSQHSIPTNPGSSRYTIWAYTRPYPPVNNFFWYPWANFDGVHYLTIAGDGAYKDNADGRFFPLYPFAISSVYFLLGAGPFMGLKEFIVGFILTNGFFFAALVMLYKLIQLDYPDIVAFTTIILLLVFPTAFFFGSFYSEGIFLFLTFLTFYYIRKKAYGKASLTSLLLSLTRIVGVCMIPITAYFYILDHKKALTSLVSQTWRERWHTLKPLITMPLGILFIMTYSLFQWHDILYVVHSQQGVVEGRRVGEIILFPQTLVRYAKILLTVPYTHYDWWISLLEFGSFWFGALGLWYAWKKGVQKRYILFSIFMFAIATQSGTFNGLPRYVIVLFPIFLALSLTKSWIAKGLYILACAIALFFLLAYFSKGYFVA